MKLVLIFLIISVFLTISLSAQEADLDWPREIETDKTVITMYQPQPESFKEDTLEGRMAISIKPADEDMIFCAVWLKAVVSTDTDGRTFTLESVSIPRVNFPDMDDVEKIDKFKNLLINEIESWDIEMSLDHVLASLNEVEDLKNEAISLNNDPPDIFFRTVPTILVSIDGEPIIKDIEDAGLEYVANTAFFIVKEKSKSNYYIRGGQFWYVSDDLLSGWQETNKVPDKIEKFAADNLTEEEEPDSISASYTEAPGLIISTKPAELILTDGEPDYQTITGTSLLYVLNSEIDIIMDINTQEHFILLAGRWFTSKTLNDGDWKFQEPSELPDEFAKIPEESDMALVRASIPGTPEAQDALLEQNIPQTAVVDRKEASVKVEYDGNPEFKKVENTDVAYAVNTDKTVMRINDKYYCVDDAIWFVSDKATGPWEVSDVRPDEVDDLPPSSEVYNVKYVYIYDSTPEVVYVGYYPGYTYSYVYGGVVVYGTGYWYHPWYRVHYYPRPVTWGFGVHYNPRTGWGFSFGIRVGWVGWRFHPYRGWWGPRGYRAGYRHGYRRGARAGYRAGYRAGQRNANRNVYRNRSSGVKQTRDVNKGSNKKNIDNKSRPSNKSNNLYADKNGNVHQRNNNGSWEQKSNKKTSPTTNQKPSNTVKQSGNQQSQNKQLDRSYDNRSHGSKNYNKNRSSSSRSRSGGGRRR